MTKEIVMSNLFFTSIMVFATAGTAASVLLWGIWGPPLWFVAVTVAETLIALVIEVTRLIMGGLPGHDLFWANVMLIKAHAFMWWLFAIPSIVVALLLRWFKNTQRSGSECA
jgi:hypothetical protein